MSDDIVINNTQKTHGRGVRIFGIVVVLLIALAGICVLIWNLIPKDYDKVTIVNSSELSEINNEVANFKTELLNLLRNNGIIGENDKVNDVVVREGSVASVVDDYKDGHWKTTTFLVDIDSLKQTFLVKIVESDSVDLPGVTAQIYCPKVSESKYPDTECKGLYQSTNNSLEYNLPREFKLATGEKVLVKKIDETMKGRTRLKTVQVYLYSCKDSNPPVAEAEDVVKKWVESLNDPIGHFYTYNIRTGYCEGDAI